MKKSAFGYTFCMSVLLCTIAAGLVAYSFGKEHPASASAAATLTQSQSAEIDNYMNLVLDRLNLPGAAVGIVDKNGAWDG
ncbi:hypothetical protein [Paenibacillus sp. NEAU-GSW1]|uniref:hypothetical protein n=1 Tax=Paenibacillus sp. NEAU-GSW1 TaxID=2682486 RepID=UPI0012E0D3C2|nr:hypothetical protein [Paenibacillus sp. NEAU-GSW1]MUT64824.1 hypothetical protein [Paenibacillus sp. NEAU-GSW1]